MTTRLIALAAAVPLALSLIGCSPEDEATSMDNHDRNQQEFQNTATEPAGPRESSPPSNLSNE
jgi:hypothetical protein